MKIPAMKDLKEFFELKDKLFGDNLFVVLDEESEEVKRYNELAEQCIPFVRYMRRTS